MSEQQERSEEKKHSSQTQLCHQQEGQDSKHHPPGWGFGGSLENERLLLEASSDGAVFAPEAKSGSDSKPLQSHRGQDNSELLIDINQSFAQHLYLTPDISGSSSEYGDQVSLGSEGASLKSHEAAADFSNASRPESLSLKSSKSDKEFSEAETVPAEPAPESSGFEGSVRRKTEPMGMLSKQLKDNDGYSSLSKSLPQGTITRKGDLIEFVASDLQEKIKQSSPLSQPGE